ncbi:uncharacterized protein [Chironomus tepperi]|uniref:uncharacterized protein n=1 Tax=Chironomus tepperi TaxID=113505 RepID=UPI00391FC3E1
MNSQEIDNYIKQLLSMSTSQLTELNERCRIEIDELENDYTALKMENSRLTERLAAVDKEVNEINITREKTKKKIAKLEKNKNEMLKSLNEFNENMVDTAENFHESHEKAKEVKKMYEERCLEIRGSRDEFQAQSSKLEAEIKEAELELTHKKDSLSANQQVLESKIACLAKDQEECNKKAKELQLLTDKNHDALLKELEQKEEDMKLEFSDLSAKLAESYKNIDNLDAEQSSLIVETDRLLLDLTVEEKCNQKSETELNNEEENVEQLANEMMEMEANAIHNDNLELAMILREDLIQNEENIKEIELLEREMAEIEVLSQELDILKEQKIEELKKLEAEVSVSAEEKAQLEKLMNTLNDSIVNDEEIIQAIKKKIAEKEEAYKKREEAPNGDQLTGTKETQLTFKTAKSKIPKTTRPKSKKAKEPPVTKPKQSPPNDVEQMNISNEEHSEPNVFSSGSSGESNMSFSMSSSLAGSKPDIMNILANLSGNFSSSRRNTGNTE